MFALAAVMDFRIKLSDVEFFIKNINELLNVHLTIIGKDIKSTITTLYNSYEMKYSPQRTTSATTSIPSTSISGVRGKTTCSGYNAITNFNRQITSLSSRIELSKYLDTDFSGFLTDDMVKRPYKIFFDTRDLLNHLVSTVASEVVFSVGNRQMDERRSLLSPDILECQICVKNWDDTKYRIQPEVIEIRHKTFQQHGSVRR